MARYGIYGSHTPETCPIYFAKYAQILVDIAELEPEELATAYGIHQIEAQYHSALEHTFLWIVEAEEPHLIEAFGIDSGLASFNTIRIVPIHTFAETVDRLKIAHHL